MALTALNNYRLEASEGFSASEAAERARYELEDAEQKAYEALVRRREYHCDGENTSLTAGSNLHNQEGSSNLNRTHNYWNAKTLPCISISHFNRLTV